MAYVKPGVEITQEQVTVSPNLTSPDLIATLIGKPFFVEEVDDYAYIEAYSGIELDVPYAGLPAGGIVHEESVYVDLVVGSGADAGTVIHLVPTTDFTAGAASVTVNAGLETTYGTITGVDDGSAIKMGYRALRTDLDSVFQLQSITDAEDELGSLSSMNPLGLGALKALQNAGSSILVSTVDEASPLETSNEFTSADMQLDPLKSRELYAMVPLTSTSGTIDALKSHALTYSDPTNKRERMVVAAPSIPWTGTVGEELNDTAGVIKSNAYQQQERRLVYVFPDVAYTTETRHVSSLGSTYIDAVQGTTGQDVYLGQPYNVTVSGVVYKYKKGAKLTAAALANLATDNSFLLVEVPVPGYILAAGIAGQIGGGLEPSDPHTNVPVSGFNRLHYSTDTFSETDFNLMAEGGNYVMIQNSETGPVYCRHQMTTDVTSVERRELSILKSLDFVSKFIRNGLAGYIGRYNITPQFMKLLNMTLQAQALYLVREGHVNDLKILKVEQDETQQDTILVTLSVGVKYPVNYIKITLQF